jgi:hypothetical protein
MQGKANSMLTHETSQPGIIEGTWEEIARQADKLSGHRLRVVILPDEPQPPTGRMITKGMFPQLIDLTEEDFKTASGLVSKTPQ